MAFYKMPSEQEILRCAKALYPVAALYLGGQESGKEALTEAAVSALRKQPPDFSAALSTELIRICRTRAPERPEQADLPAALMPLMKLPAGSRRDLALSLCGFSTEQAAAACGKTEEEQQRSTEKASRQLTFSQGGISPETEQLSAAAHSLKWTAADAEKLINAVSKAGEEQPAASNVREIVRTSNHAQKQGKTVSVPLWGIVTAVCCVSVLFLILLVLALQRKPQPAAVLPLTEENEPQKPARSVVVSDYLPLETVQQKAAEAAGAENPVFLSTKLKTDSTPAFYSISLLSGGVQTELVMDAVSGEIKASDSAESELKLDMAHWKTAPELRQTVLDYMHAEADQVLFLKEKCGTDDDLGYYKYELTDADGKYYSIQVEAVTGALMKYTLEEPKASSASANVLPPETIMQRALARAGDLQPDQVIFTKLKLDDGVYLVAFTLDDGTQYLMELDAQSGMANTVDVNPVSADTTHAAGLLAAKETALQMAGLPDQPDVQFTKAKIDRSSGAYVYELEFETAEYDYEVTLNTESCEILKFRASQIS